MYRLKDVDVENKRVLLRVDFNVPLHADGRVANDKRIRETLPTIRYLISKKAKVVILTHVGRPNGDQTQELRTTTIAHHLGKMLGVRVTKLDDCVGDSVKQAIDSMKSGDVVMLENVRFHDEEKSKDAMKRTGFARQLASLADIYVNDAFANSHRDHASMTGVPLFVLGCMGFMVQREMEAIAAVLAKPKRPFVSLVGGFKADKLKTLKYLAEKSDKVLVGGSLAFMLLKAQGKNIGATKTDADGASVSDIQELLTYKNIILPIDCVLADGFHERANTRLLSTDKISHGMAVDIGPETIMRYADIIKTASTVIWNGPMGAFEIEKFSQGTLAISHALAAAGATTIVGGGESAAAVEKNKLEHRMTHVSTGGGASLVLFQGDKLPAITALEQSAKLFELEPFIAVNS